MFFVTLVRELFADYLSSIPDKEGVILDEMKTLKRSRKEPKREASFHRQRPGVAVMKQKERMKNIAGKSSKSPSAQKSSNKVINDSNSIVLSA